MKGDDLTYKGFLTTDEKDPKKRENIGKVALGKQAAERKGSDINGSGSDRQGKEIQNSPVEV